TSVTATVTSGGAPAQGATVTFAQNGGATFPGGASCTTVRDGTCSVQVTKGTYGAVSVTASTDLTDAGTAKTTTITSGTASITFRETWAAAAPPGGSIRIGSSGGDVSVSSGGTTSTRQASTVTDINVSGTAGSSLVVDATGGSVAAHVTNAGAGGSLEVKGAGATWAVNGTSGSVTGPVAVAFSHVGGAIGCGGAQTISEPSSATA